MSANQAARDALTRARWQAARKLSYLSRGLYAMTFVETPDLDPPTIAVDQYFRVYYRPEYVLACEKSETLIGEIVHECLHPTMRHAQRAKVCCATDYQRWNESGDREIDQRIEAAGVKLVDDRVRCSPGTERWTAEEHYRDAKQGQSKKPRCGGGSGADGQKRPHELGKPGDPGVDAKSGGLTEAAADVVRTQVASAIRAHANTKGRGTVPAGLLRWAEEQAEPVPVPWTDLAAARIRYAVASKLGPAPSYARPSRRDAGSLVLPVHRMPHPRIALVLDTSASMGGADIAKEIAIVYDACETLGQVFAVACDTSAGEIAEVRHVEDLRPFMTGGGGTNMRVGVRAAEDLNPDAIVLVTDGETPWPETETDASLVVVLTRPTAYPPPSWAEVIEAY